MTKIKRPFLLQVKSLHDDSNPPAGDQEPTDAEALDEPDGPSLAVQGSAVTKRRRPRKTQSMILATPSFELTQSEIDSMRASMPTDLEQYYDPQPKDKSGSSNNSCNDSPSLILPYLYVGDQAQTQIDTISNLNISYILSLQSLPKFLTNSPQSTPPVTPTKDIEPHLTKSRTSAHRSDVSEVPFSFPSDKFSNNNERARSVHKNCDDKRYRIIDGGEGGLLPSTNSSKDYLVKIEQSRILDHNEFVSKRRIVEEYDLKDCGCHDHQDIHDRVTTEKTKCDITIQNQVHQAYQSSRMDVSDDELNCDNINSNSSSKSHDNRNSQGSSACSSILSRRSIKQRCNKISSSVHRLIKGKCINISDTFEQLVDKFFDETHNFIEEARRNKCNVLVHCKAGISRSPTIAIAYLMKWKRLHLQDAYNFVKRCRPQISPNLNFMGQLVSYERQLQLTGCRIQLHKPFILASKDGGSDLAVQSGTDGPKAWNESSVSEIESLNLVKIN